MRSVKSLYLILLLMLSHLLPACSKNGNIEGDLLGFEELKRQVYGSAMNYNGVQQNLEMDVYVPESNHAANPLLLVLHSGGFYNGNREELADFCRFFAQRGFTAVTVSYRLGWQTGTDVDFCAGNASSMMKAAYRATQDAKAALRYLVANAAKYKINPQQVFVGGASAGAFAALAAAFMNQQEFNTMFPGIATELGGINNSGNSISQTVAIKGVVNMWGGVIHPSVIGTNDQIPVISFHGAKDSVVPYEKGHFAGCDNYPSFYGSKEVYNFLNAAHLSAVLHTDPAGEHGVYTKEYLAQNSYCFLKALIAGKKPKGSFTYTVSACS